MRKLVAVMVVVGLLVCFGGTAAAGEKLMVYTSMKESLIGKLRDAFDKKHPEVAFDYYSAGAGKLMAKVAAERQSQTMPDDLTADAARIGVPDVRGFAADRAIDLLADLPTLGDL